MRKNSFFLPSRTVIAGCLFLSLLLPCLPDVTASVYAELIEGEPELHALPEAPALPPDIHSESDLYFAAAKDEITLLNPQGPVPVPGNVLEKKDIEYGNVNGRALLLDLYLPRDQDADIPGILFIHGGGWASGNRSDYKYYTVRLAQMGYAVATISYRFVSEASFPACVEDAKCAVRWMRAHAKEYRICPDTIAVAGGSAGGHLAMMTGYSSDIEALEGTGGYPEFSSAVQAVINLYGPTDLTPVEFHDHPTLKAFFGGKTFNEAPESYALASPIRHLDKSDPPTLVIHGTDDSIVPVAQADLLVARLEALEIPHEYLRLEGYPHTLDIIQEVNQCVRWHMYRFLEKYLKK